MDQEVTLGMDATGQGLIQAEDKVFMATRPVTPSSMTPSSVTRSGILKYHIFHFTGPAGTAHLSQGEVTIHLRIGVMYIQTPARPNKATRSDIEPEAANKVSTSPPSSTASASDKISLTQETTDDANAPTVEQAMDTHNQEVEGVKSEELKVDTVPPEVKRIEEIMKNSGELEEKVAAYTGVLGSKEYIYIEESLVAILLQLDKVETNGNIEIRKSRKSAVCKIQHVLTELESKAKSNMATAELSNKAEAMATDEVVSPATTACW